MNHLHSPPLGEVAFRHTDAVSLVNVRLLCLVAELAELNRAWEKRMPKLSANHSLDRLGKGVARHALKGDEIHRLIDTIVIGLPRWQSGERCQSLQNLRFRR